MITRCAKCNAPMSCSPQGSCWCAELPAAQPAPDATGCLCPECLREKIREQQKNDASRSSAAS